MKTSSLHTFLASAMLFGTAAFAADGDLDTTYNTPTGFRAVSFGASDNVYGGIMQPDGKFLVIGGARPVTNQEMSVARFNADGTLDTATFGSGTGKFSLDVNPATTTDRATCGGLQSDGKIILGGYSRTGSGNDDYAVIRLNTNGTLDTTFGTSGITKVDFNGGTDRANALVVLSDNSIVLTGMSSDFNASPDIDYSLAKITPNGALDTTFDTDGKVTVDVGEQQDAGNGLTVQSDGKIIFCGQSFAANGDNIAVVGRLTSTGALDTTFGGGDGLYTATAAVPYALNDVKVQSDGMIVVCGTANVSSQIDGLMLRLTSAGVLDTGFNTTGILTLPLGTLTDAFYSLFVQADGKIVAGGFWQNPGPNVLETALIRVNTNGTLDSGFATGGIKKLLVGSGQNRPVSIRQAADGKILVALETGASSNEDFTVARFLNTVAVAAAPEIAVTETGVGAVADGGSFSFGTTTVGTPVTKTFTVTNSGTATLNLSALSVPSGFTIAANFGSATVAASGGTTTFQITMSAGAAATPSGTLTFTNDDADENPYNFTVSGTVNAAPPPAIATVGTQSSVNAANTLSFTVPAGTNRLLVVTASHADNAGLALTNVTFGASGMTQAVLSSDGSSSVDTIWTLPMASGGAVTDTITVTRNAGASSRPCSFISAQAFVNVDQASPFQTVAAANADKLSANNPGSSLTITSSASDVVFDIFDLYSTNSTIVSTPGGGQTVVSNSTPFDLAASGAVTGYTGFALYKTTTKPGTGATANMSWTSTAPGGAMLSAAISIKQAAGGGGSPAPVVTSINPTSGSTAGGTSVTITGTGFTGATGATVGGVALTGFSVSNDTTILGTTGAHAAGAVDVAVTGSPVGASTGGTGIFTYVAPLPTVTFSNANLLQNALNFNIDGTNFALIHTDNTVVLSSGTAHVAGQTGQATLNVVFDTPPSVGPLTAIVTTPAGNSGAAVQVATVILPPAPEIAVSGLGTNIADGSTTISTADDTDFGSEPVQGGSVTHTFTITNSGTANLTLGTVGLTGGGAAHFAVTQPLLSTVPISGTTTFTVTYDPSAAAAHTATVSFTNNDGNESPFDFNVQGVGTPAQTFDLASNAISNTPFDGGQTYIFSAGPPPPIPVSSPAGDVVTSGGAPDATGADSGLDFDVLGRGGFLAENGMLAFPGELTGPGVDATNFKGFWKHDNVSLKRLARTGDDAPETGSPAAKFSDFPLIPGINDDGQVTLLAALGTTPASSPPTTGDNDIGLWSELGGTGFQILIREGDPVPPVAGALVDKFGSGCFATANTGASTGEAAFTLTMKGASTDTALLRASITGPTVTAVGVVARENDPAPGIAGQFFANLNGGYTDSVRMDAQGNICFGAVLKPSGSTSLWYQPVAGGAPVKVFVAGDAAPDAVGATPVGRPTFASLDLPTMGGSGTFCFRGVLNLDGDNTLNDKNDGIWRGTAAGPFTNILRRGDNNTNRPGLFSGPILVANPNIKAGNIFSGWLNNANHGAWLGWIDLAGDGISGYPADSFGVYTDIGGTMNLLIASGDLSPGIGGGATMFYVDHPVAGGAGASESVAFIGTVTGGGTTAANNKGIWRSTGGAAPTLVIRTGDTMTVSPGGAKTIADVDIPGSGDAAHIWETPVMDATGRLLIFVTFIDGTTAEVIVP